MVASEARKVKLLNSSVEELFRVVVDWIDWRFAVVHTVILIQKAGLEFAQFYIWSTWTSSSLYYHFKASDEEVYCLGGQK